MKHTEAYFGLQKINDRVSADNGKTFLPKFFDMTVDEWEVLIINIENYIEKELTFGEIEDLKEILS